MITAEQVFASIANGLIITDDNDTITVFNPAAEKILNISAAAVIGKNVDEAIPNSRLSIVKQTGHPELNYRQSIGKSVIITNRTPIIIDGHVKGTVAIFEDISAYEKVVWELREVKELKERLQLILESVQDGICVLDKEGYITYVNSSYLRIVDGKREQLIGENVKQLSPNGARNKVLTSGRQIIGSISKKANGVTIVANVNPIIIDGEITGAVSIVKNVSEVQSLMEKLQQTTAKAEYLEEELLRAKKPGRCFDKFIGRSGKVIDALTVAAKAAQGSFTVMIRGESGTGKELVAEGIHYSSPRAAGPFIRINCAAIPSTLLESELFGYEKGAFTGALKRKLGKFELANNGTVFLDEVGELEKNMQAKLLRVLQSKEIEPIGSETTIKVDIRIIAATNQDLERMVANGDFREDLYYRLNVIPIFLPPLRERKEDIPLLVEFFLTKICRQLNKEIKKIRWDALEALINYHWPGNVRELENVMERVVTMMDGSHIEISDLPYYLRERSVSERANLLGDIAQQPILPWKEYEKQIIKMALEKYGSFNAAGKALGLTHKTIASKAKKYGLQKVVAWEKGATAAKNINKINDV
jgi:PAS domain S-box-containing protein